MAEATAGSPDRHAPGQTGHGMRSLIAGSAGIGTLPGRRAESPDRHQSSGGGARRRRAGAKCGSAKRFLAAVGGSLTGERVCRWGWPRNRAGGPCARRPQRPVLGAADRAGGQAAWARRPRRSVDAFPRPGRLPLFGPLLRAPWARSSRPRGRVLAERAGRLRPGGDRAHPAGCREDRRLWVGSCGMDAALVFRRTPPVRGGIRGGCGGSSTAPARLRAGTTRTARDYPTGCGSWYPRAPVNGPGSPGAEPIAHARRSSCSMKSQDGRFCCTGA